MIEYYYTSNFQQPNQYQLPAKNRMQLGKMKDEHKGVAISEFVCVESKDVCNSGFK